MNGNSAGSVAKPGSSTVMTAAALGPESVMVAQSSVTEVQYTLSSGHSSGAGTVSVHRSCAVPQRVGEMACQSLVRDDVKVRGDEEDR